MRPLERLIGPRSLWGALLLCLTLVGAGADARSRSGSLPEVRPATASQMQPMGGAQPMSSLADCVPCAGCYIAPAPATHGFSGECKESEASVSWVQAVPALSAERWVDTVGNQTRLPIRIAFCRWLN